MRRTRAFKPSTLSEPLRYFLETGDYRLRELFPNHHRERAEVFRLAYPAERMRGELRKIWELHREEILRDWKSEKKKGLPWCAKLFDRKGERKGWKLKAGFDSEQVEKLKTGIPSIDYTEIEVERDRKG